MAKKQMKILEAEDGTRWVFDPETGDKHPASADELGNIEMQVPKMRAPTTSALKSLPPAPEGTIEHDVPATDAWLRFKLKNLVTDPELTKRVLDAQGYDVKPYGSGFNFLLRPKGHNEIPWRPFDPMPSDQRGRGFGYGEFFRDMLDLTADAANIAILSRTGPVGKGAAGILTKMAKTGLMSAGAEAARELAGVPVAGAENISPGQIGVAGVAGGLAEGAAGAAPIMFAKTRNAYLKTAAKIIGIQGAAGAITPGEVVSKRAAIKGFGKVKSFDEAMTLMRDEVQKVSDITFPETLDADAIANAAEAAGVQIDLSDAIDYLHSHVKVAQLMPPVTKGGIVVREAGERLAPVTSIGARAIVREKGVANHVKSELNALLDEFSKGGGTDYTQTTPTLAIAMLRDLQASAAAKGGFGIKLTGPGEETRGVFSKAAGLLNAELKAKLSQGLQGAIRSPNSGLTYSELMGVLEGKTKLLEFHKNMLQLGRDKNSPEKIAKALSAIRSSYGDTKFGVRQYVADFDKTFGTNLSETLEEAIIGEAFGEGGEAALIPRMTATGGILGAGLAGGGGFEGYRREGVWGGIKGAALGLGTGAALASPLSITAQTKLGQRLINPLAQRIAATDPLARAGLVTAINEATRRFRAAEKERQDAQKP